MIVGMKAAKMSMAAVLAGVLLIATSGCVAVAAAGAGAATYAYASGALKTTVDATVPATQQAAEAAVDRLGFSLVSSAGDQLEAEVISRTAGDDKVRIKIKSLSDDASEIRIRVGMFGDETRSARIYEEIKGHL